ncbi:MAG: HD domain-containing protein [Paludibacteraceae bacterium]|nr:HD domain-containing protein [Paludibacteraceae bacterium]
MNYNVLIDKYYSGNPELKNILLVHSRQVADRALRIVDSHPELQVDRQFVEEAAMLHDIGIIFCDAPNIHCYGTHHYMEHGWLGAELLRREGYPRHADVAERHTGTGITLDTVLANDWNIPAQDYTPRTTEEEIICYADKFYSKSHIYEEVPYQKVRNNIWRYGSDSVARFDKWRTKFENNLIL